MVHLLGPPGTGKSHIAIALGFEAIKVGKSVFLATLAEIITSRPKAQREGDLTSTLCCLARPALLIVNELVSCLRTRRRHRDPA